MRAAVTSNILSIVAVSLSEGLFTNVIGSVSLETRPQFYDYAAWGLLFTREMNAPYINRDITQ